MVMNVLSVCVTVLILALHHADPSTEVPAWLYNLLFRRSKVGLTERDQIQEITGIEKRCNETESYVHCLKCEGSKSTELGQNHVQMDNARKWQNVARILNKIFFWVFLVAFVIMLIVCIALWLHE